MIFDARQYRGLFDSWGNVLSQFEAPADRDNPEPEYVFAVYDRGDYGGSADVVFKRDGKWFQNIGGHCSCYGLEGQWAPEEFDPVAHFEARKKDRWLIYPVYKDEDPFNAWLKEAAAPELAAAEGKLIF